MQANPTIRSVGESWGWTAAYDRSTRLAAAPATLKAITAPVVMLGDPVREPQARAACSALPACRWEPLAGAAPHIADDAVRAAWLKTLDGFIDEHTRGYSVAAPPAPPSSSGAAQRRPEDPAARPGPQRR